MMGCSKASLIKCLNFIAARRARHEELVQLAADKVCDYLVLCIATFSLCTGLCSAFAFREQRSVTLMLRPAAEKLEAEEAETCQI